MGVIGLVLSTTSILAWLLASEQIPEMFAKSIFTISNNKYVILILLNLLLMVIGMFMNMIAALVILAPMLAPLVNLLDIHPIHFGIMVCVNMNLALITPPIGGCLFLAMAISNLKMGQILKELWPILLLEFGVLLLVVFIPEITMFLPRLLGLLD